MQNIIVVGDGLTDIPCFSLIEKQGGRAIGVYDRNSKKRGKMEGLIREKRITHPVAADYRRQSGLDDAVELAINMAASRKYS